MKGLILFMRRRLVAALLVTAVIPLTGCGGFPGHGMYRSATLDERLDGMALTVLFDAIALDFCKSSRLEGIGSATERAEKPERTGMAVAKVTAPPPVQETVIVADFVDLGASGAGSSCLWMAELMRGSLDKVCAHRIVQGDFSKAFTITDRGVFVAAPSAGQAGIDAPADFVFVGTYDYRSNKLMLFVKKISLPAGKIERVVTREIDFGRDQAGRAIHEVR